MNELGVEGNLVHINKTCLERFRMLAGGGAGDCPDMYRWVDEYSLGQSKIVTFEISPGLRNWNRAFQNHVKL